MNNFKAIKDIPISLSAKQKLEQETALSNSEQILQAIKALKESQDFFTLRRFVLDPSLEIVQRRIERNLNELVKKPELEREILQDQGFVIAFRKFADLDTLEKIYENEVVRLTKILRK